MAAARRKDVKKKPSTLESIKAMEKERQLRRQQMDEQKRERQNEEKRNAELGVVGDADFVRMIDAWRNDQPASAPHLAFDCEAAKGRGKDLCICVRKRPIGKRELAANDHDAVSCTNPVVTVHDCRHRVDGITKYLANAKFVFDHAFSETVHTDDVYACVAAPLVDFVVRKRGRATVFAYGQTGSGKTYTMEGIETRAARDVFAAVGDAVDVGVSFFEIYGGRCQDLLRNRARLQVREDGKGEVNVVDLSEARVESADALLEAIEQGNKLRTTQRTEANDASSRSHAVCQIVLREGSTLVGKLSLVDLAGSERGADTRSHNRQLRTESAEINKSLLALKECIRGLATNDAHVPFRASKLTMVLRDSFVRPHCRVAMIATVSPSVSATDHTINTLRYADRVKEKPANANLLRNKDSQPSPGQVNNNENSAPNSAPPAVSNNPPRRSLEAARRSLDSRQGGRRGLPANNGGGPLLGPPAKPVFVATPVPANDDLVSSLDAVPGWPPAVVEPKRPVVLAPAVSPPPKNFEDAVIDDYADDDDAPDDAAVVELHKTVDSLFEEEEALLNAHMNLIQENAELLTEEGRMLQQVQGGDVVDYDIDTYVARLAAILDTKQNQIQTLRARLTSFAQKLKDEENQSKLVRKMPLY